MAAPGLGRSGVVRLGLRLTTVAAAAAIIVAGSLLVGGIVTVPNVGGRSPAPPDGSPSAAAEGHSSAAASPSLSATVSAPPAPTPVAGPIGAPLPADFQSVAGTFLNADLGWVLGRTTCSGNPCAGIVRTADGGGTWVSIPAPKTAFTTGEAGNAGVSRLRFADPMNGWAYGPDLWATHNGGATWQEISLPGTTGVSQVMALGTAGGAVHVAFFDGGSSGRLAIMTSPVGTDGWVTSSTSVVLGAGPVPQAQIVLHEHDGWLIEVDRTIVAGARLVSGAWTAWQPPCKSVEGPALLAASSSSDLIAACDVGQWSTPTGVHLFNSSDGGATFVAVGPKVPVGSLDAVAAPLTGVALVAGPQSEGTSVVAGSFDGGATWAPVLTFQPATSVDLVFPTATDGFMIATQPNGPSRMFSTSDGGRTWSRLAIAGG